MKLPPPVPPVAIPDELSNPEFLRILASDPAGRAELENIRDRLGQLRTSLLSQAGACEMVIENVTRALSAVGTDVHTERAH